MKLVEYTFLLQISYTYLCSSSMAFWVLLCESMRWIKTLCSPFSGLLDGCCQMGAYSRHLSTLCILSLFVVREQHCRCIVTTLLMVLLLWWNEDLGKSHAIYCGSQFNGCTWWWQRCHRRISPIILVCSLSRPDIPVSAITPEIWDPVGNPLICL